MSAVTTTMYARITTIGGITTTSARITTIARKVRACTAQKAVHAYRYVR
jgi:hypothetical protein